MSFTLTLVDKGPNKVYNMYIITEAEVEETVETANENLNPSFDYKKDLTMS